MADRQIRAGVPFELQGFWWDASDHGQAGPVFGHLKYEPDGGIDLEMFEWQGMINSAATSTASALFGQSLKGVPCTVFDAIEVNRQSHLPGAHSRGEWRSSVMAHGAWIKDRSRVPARKVVVTWRGLAEWLSRASETPRQRGQVMNRDAEPLTIDLSDGTRLTVGFDAWRENGQFEEGQKWIASIAIEPAVLSTLGEIEERYVFPLRDLVLFGTEEQTVTDSLTLYGLDEVESDLVEGARRAVEIVVQDSSRPLVAERNAFNHLLMPFAVWAGDPGALIERWLDLHGKLGKAANLLFATLNNWPAYVENRFLNLTAFAEAYHRTLHDSPPVTPDEHEVATEQMLQALPTNKLRNHYGPRLKYADEQGLRARMKELFRRAGQAVEDVEGWRAGGLPDSLVETRNALTHRAGSDEKTLEGSALFWATKRLLVVLQINILLDLRLSSEVAAACIAQRHRTSRTLFDPI
jgi:hypothetical protein